ncbi:MAG TPA: HdeD family acid-resistance protein [Chloroflexota bacterium]|nr:HdeD family acid-resistance protein [Chloroflexota bacterium]
MENRAEYVQPWWALAVGGIVSILFGIVAMAWPGLTLVVLVWLYGIYAIIFGIVQLVAMFRAIGSHTTWWPHLLFAIISLVAGIYVVANPGMSSLILAVVIGIWAIAVGAVEIVAGAIHAHFMEVIAGVITVLFGLILFANPAAGALALVWVIGIFAIVRGIIMIVDAFRAPAGGPAAT